MIKKKNTSYSQPLGSDKNRDGLALLFTMVVLVVLSTIAYTLSARLATFRKQQQYMIDYQQSRYACDSAMKYALTTVKDVSLSLATRKDSPDFSDLFTLNKDEYQQMLLDWAELKAEEEAMNMDDSEFGIPDETPAMNTPGPEGDMTDDLTEPVSATNPDDPNSMNDFGVFDMELDLMDPNEIEIPGPYGVDWPMVQEPIEFEIGNSRIIITIEDENAKMPLTWAMTKDVSVSRRARTAFETFCEWMQMDSFEIEDLFTQVEDIGTHKQFTINPKPISYTEKTTVKTTPRTSRTSRSSRTSSRTSRSITSTRLTKKTRPAIAHTTDFAKLLHSSMLDTEKLAWALPDTGDRYESPLKYIALWGSQRVNINTAPRHVLEAAFTFGGDAREIAHEIIQLRREKPIKDIDELKTKLYGFNDSIRKTEPYICTRSKFFSVKVTAITGSTRASSVATVIREGKTVKRIAILAN